MNQHYSKKEKLKQKKQIDYLFAKGKWKTNGNLRVISVNLEKKPSADFQVLQQKVGVSVSKKYFKKAVDRNRIKRLLRDAYRRNKEQFSTAFGTQSLSMIFWISPEKPSDLHIIEENFCELCKSAK